MMHLFRGFGLLTTALLACGEAPESMAPVPAHDFIFVSVDTLRADHLPFYGYSRETAGSGEFSVAWLAKNGQVHDQCWAPVGKTLPSLASFWTTVSPLEHGAVANTTPVQVSSLAERFRRNGYRTLALVANRTLGPEMGLAAGFDQYAIAHGPNEERIPAAMLTKAVPTIEKGQPLMLWTHFMAPHQPYDPPAAFASRFLAAGDNVDPIGSNALLGSFHADPESLDAPTHAHLIALYDAEIFATVTWIQELLSGLDQAYRSAGRGGLLDNAVVVFFSDHGEELADHHGYFMHAKSLYSGVLRVPLVVAGPGVEVGRDPRPIQISEILPWLLDQVPPSAQSWCSSWQTQFYGIRDPRWTLLHNPGRNPMGPLEPPDDVAFAYPEVALYDRQADPQEQHDVAEAHPAEVRRLLADLQAWWQAAERREPHYLPGQDPQARLQMLESLGYLDEVPDQVIPPWRPEDWQP